MEYQYKISAVICSYNRARFIINAVESIFNQDFDKSQFEVIVVDNNSTDNVIELLKRYKEEHPSYNFSYYIEPNQGVAFTRTRCAKEAKGSIVAYLDDDSTAEPNWLANIVNFYDAHPEVWSIGGKITPKFLTGIPDWYSKYFFGLVGNFDLGNKIKRMTGERYPCGANMSFRKKVFEEIGYFNHSLGRRGKGLLATEEKEIYKRILAYGKQVYYLPMVAVLHCVEANKFDHNYVKRHSKGIGGGERVRLEGQYGWLLVKFLEYIAKWVYAILYGLGFLVRGQWSKFIMLERFRWWVIMGFISPKGAD
ncbi:MAG: glycosyltransferase family 2 protein [Chitinophagia bacterium]|nr:glycosyltransferase family 2 protein [Chitinophagia bacterium]